MKPFLSTALKGFAMGTANVVPGVSGGTIALITGIYSRLVACISAFATPSIWEEFFRGNFGSWWQKVDGSFLAAIFVGLAVSILTFAKVVTWSLVEYPVVTWAFFFGLIIVSTADMLYDIKAWKIKDFLFILIGFGLGLAFCFLTPTQTPQTGWFYFVSGAIAICTMILPGVSGSFLLQIFGNYDIVMASLDVADINWSVLLPFAFGCLVGIIAFSKFLKWLLAHYERPTMILLLGFVIGTLLKVWPWADAEAVQQAGHGLQILPAIVAMLLGGALVALIQKLSKKA